MKAPDPALPPWQARNERDRWAMIEFTVAELLHEDWELEDQRDPRALLAFRSPKPSPERQLEQAKVAARHGNLAPLRELFPQIAEFIAEPKRGRGVHRPPSPLLQYGRNHTYAVTNTVTRVRRIWRKYYGKWKRPAGDNLMVEVIAEYLSLTDDVVRRTMKSASR
jgi:hypothetical protein